MCEIFADLIVSTIKCLLHRRCVLTQTALSVAYGSPWMAQNDISGCGWDECHLSICDSRIHERIEVIDVCAGRGMNRAKVASDL
jgi:hypothetical protein